MAGMTPSKRPCSEVAGTPPKLPRTALVHPFTWWPKMKICSCAADTRGRLDSARSPGLKINPTWVREMVLHKKDMELRTYEPFSYTPTGQAPIHLGERMFILSAGYLCGSCRLAEVLQFTDWTALESWEGNHRVSRDSKIGGTLTKTFDSNRPVYGWILEDFHWCPVPLPSGKDGVPQFRGQVFGQVWTTATLPAALEDRSG